MIKRFFFDAFQPRPKRSHHSYRAILPYFEYSEMVLPSGGPDYDRIGERYNDYLRDHSTETGVIWTGTEMLWHHAGAKTVRLTESEAAFDIMVQSVSVDETVKNPELAKKTVCYEFPVQPEVPFGGIPMAAVLIHSTPKDVMAVLQGADGTNCVGFSYSKKELKKKLNRSIGLREEQESFTNEELAKIEQKRMIRLIYILAQPDENRAKWHQENVKPVSA